MAEAPARDGTTDPTLNVRENLADAVERQDDLRAGLRLYLDTRINDLGNSVEDRVAGIQRELDNIERRRIEHKEDTQTAVNAAFTAAKEAVKEQAGASDKAISKSEGTVSGQIKAVEGTVDDLKDRIGKLETQQQTKTETRSDSRSGVGMVVGIIGSIFGFLALLITAVALVMK